MVNSTVLALFKLARDTLALGPISASKGIYSGRGDHFHVTLPQGRVTLRRGNSDFQVLRQIFSRKEYEIANYHAEQAIQARYLEIIRGGQVPVIVDAGANIGLSALWFSHRFPEAQIVAIEPDPENFGLLTENVSSSGRCTLLNAAVGSSPGSVSLINSDQGWAVKTERVERGATRIVTMSEAIAAVANGVPLLVKIDIEGFESDLFESDLDWLDSAFAVFIEPHDWMLPRQDTSRTFQKAFGERDFNLYIRGENLLYVRRVMDRPRSGWS